MQHSLETKRLVCLLFCLGQALKEIKKARDPEDGRLCCELYKKLPPRREFKDYYEVIVDPIDIQVGATEACILIPSSCSGAARNTGAPETAARQSQNQNLRVYRAFQMHPATDQTNVTCKRVRRAV